MSMFEMVQFIVKWLAAPVSAFVRALCVKIGKHDTFIAVLGAQIASDKLAHDREIKDVKEAEKSIASKLDSIELDLRARCSLLNCKMKLLNAFKIKLIKE